MQEQRKVGITDERIAAVERILAEADTFREQGFALTTSSQALKDAEFLNETGGIPQATKERLKRLGIYLKAPRS